MPLKIQHFRHAPSGTFSYVAWDNRSAAIIDPVLDYDHAAGETATHFAEQIAAFVDERALRVNWILETHAHADHLSAAQWLKERVGGSIGIGEGIRKVQETFQGIFNLKDLNIDGVQFDHLFGDGDTFRVGESEGRVINTPGHTSDSVSYLIGDAVFVGDSLFAPDKGTARADFPGGSAHTLYRSAQRLLELPDDTRVFLCHDYPRDDREYEYVHTIGEHRKRNVHIGRDIDEQTFVAKREARDKTLGMPNLILPAVQVNIRAGSLPAPEDNGTVYLKVPVNRLKSASSHG